MGLLGKAGCALTAGLMALAAAGCGTSPPAPATPTGPPPLPYASSPHTTVTGHIGTGCGMIPAHGSGSFAVMRTQPAATAVAGSPRLSAFSAAISTAGMTHQLNTAPSITMFVPANDAYTALSKSEIRYLKNPANLAAFVRRQVVNGRLTPHRMAAGGSVATLSGSELGLGKRGSAYVVGQAIVVCGNIKTANGTIYIIDRVLVHGR